MSVSTGIAAVSAGTANFAGAESQAEAINNTLDNLINPPLEKGKKKKKKKRTGFMSLLDQAALAGGIYDMSVNQYVAGGLSAMQKMMPTFSKIGKGGKIGKTKTFQVNPLIPDPIRPDFDVVEPILSRNMPKIAASWDLDQAGLPPQPKQIIDAFKTIDLKKSLYPGIPKSDFLAKRHFIVKSSKTGEDLLYKAPYTPEAVLMSIHEETGRPVGDLEAAVKNYGFEWKANTLQNLLDEDFDDGIDAYQIFSGSVAPVKGKGGDAFKEVANRYAGINPYSGSPPSGQGVDDWKEKYDEYEKENALAKKAKTKRAKTILREIGNRSDFINKAFEAIKADWQVLNDPAFLRSISDFDRKVLLRVLRDEGMDGDANTLAKNLPAGKNSALDILNELPTMTNFGSQDIYKNQEEFEIYVQKNMPEEYHIPIFEAQQKRMDELEEQKRLDELEEQKKVDDLADKKIAEQEEATKQATVEEAVTGGDVNHEYAALDTTVADEGIIAQPLAQQAEEVKDSVAVFKELEKIPLQPPVRNIALVDITDPQYDENIKLFKLEHKEGVWHFYPDQIRELYKAAKQVAEMTKSAKPSLTRITIENRSKEGKHFLFGKRGNLLKSMPPKSLKILNDEIERIWTIEQEVQEVAQKELDTEYEDDLKQYETSKNVEEEPATKDTTEDVD